MASSLLKIIRKYRLLSALVFLIAFFLMTFMIYFLQVIPGQIEIAHDRNESYPGILFHIAVLVSSLETSTGFSFTIFFGSVSAVALIWFFVSLLVKRDSN